MDVPESSLLTPSSPSSSSSVVLTIVSVPILLSALSAPFLVIGFKRKLPFLPTALGPIREALQIINKEKVARGIVSRSNPPLLLDLGSGDGRICTEFAKLGNYNSVGFELNPVLIAMSYYRAWRQSVLNKVTFKCSDFAHAKISQFDVIFMFGVNSAMANLEHRIASEAQKDSFVVCYRFPLKKRRPIHKNGDLHIYIVGENGEDAPNANCNTTTKNKY